MVVNVKVILNDKEGVTNPFLQRKIIMK